MLQSSRLPFQTLRGFGVTIFCLAGLWGCDSGSGSIHLSVLGLSSDIAKVDVTATLRGVPADHSIEVASGVNSFVVELNSIKPGDLTLTAAGLNDQNCVIVEGRTAGAVGPSIQTDLTLQVAPVMTSGHYWIKQFDSATQVPGITHLQDIWSFDANYAWVVGYNDVFKGEEFGLIVKWDGNSWQMQQASPSSRLISVWGSDPHQVWVLGAPTDGSSQSSNVIFRFDDSTMMTSPMLGMNKVWGLDATTVWVVGASGTVSRWNGATWTAQNTNATSTLWGIWGTDASHVWAVGEEGTILMWDGTSWSAQVSNTMNTLRYIWGTSSSDVWVTGDKGTILRWNGRVWSIQSGGCPTLQLGAIWGTGPNDVWAVGSQGAMGWLGQLFRWDGIAWVADFAAEQDAAGDPNDPVYYPLVGIASSDSSHLWSLRSDKDPAHPSEIFFRQVGGVVVPTLNAVDPAVAAPSGGVEISLDGQHFVTGAVVTIAGVAATGVSVVSPTHLTATLPAKPAMFDSVTVPVVVTNPDGQAVARSDLFMYSTCANLLSFNNKTFPAGMSPLSAAVQDLSGDGIPDVIVGSLGSNDCSLLLGDGRGGFGAPAGIPIDPGLSCLHPAVGDFNSDQKPDLAIGTDAGTVDVMLGSGQGGFGSPTGFLLSLAGFTVLTGDFDGDLKLDLFFVGVGAYSSVGVALGDGQGRFTGRTVLGYFPGELAAATVGDFDGDNKSDVAMVGTNGVILQLINLPNNFAPIPVAFEAQAIATGDFNHDSKLDVVVVGTGVSVLLGDGLGGLASAPNLFPGVNYSAVAVGDLNGDKRLDLVAMNPDNATVSVLLGDGQGGFSEPQTYSVGVAPTALVLADFNADGRLDLATANSGDGTISVLLQVCK